MVEKKIKCKCGELFGKIDFKKHFKNCASLKSKFKDFDFKMLQLIKAYLNSKEDLVIIKFFLQRYIIILNSKINSLFNDNKIDHYNSAKNLMNIEPKNITPSNQITTNKKYLLDIYNRIKYGSIDRGFINPSHTNPHFISANKSENKATLNINSTNPHFISANKSENKATLNINPTNPHFISANKSKNQAIININPTNPHFTSAHNQINNNEIEVFFKYEDYYELYSEKAKMNEKLVNVIERLKNKRKLNYIKLSDYPTYNGKRIDPQHTLYELGINNSNSLIVFRGLPSDLPIVYFDDNNINLGSLYNKKNYGLLREFKIEKIIFQVSCKTELGEDLAVIGSINELGNWNKKKALKMKWNKGNIWSGTLFFNYGQIKDFEYKFIILSKGIIKLWEDGNNRKFSLSQIKGLIESAPKTETIIHLKNISSQNIDYNRNNYALTIMSDWNKK